VGGIEKNGYEIGDIRIVFGHGWPAAASPRVCFYAAARDFILSRRLFFLSPVILLVPSRVEGNGAKMFRISASQLQNRPAVYEYRRRRCYPETAIRVFREKTENKFRETAENRLTDAVAFIDSDSAGAVMHTVTIDFRRQSH
jgi:hypothetical protein